MCNHCSIVKLKLIYCAEKRGVGKVLPDNKWKIFFLEPQLRATMRSSLLFFLFFFCFFFPYVGSLVVQNFFSCSVM